MDKLSQKKVVVFGDSIMYGSGNGGKGVAEYLEEMRKMKCTKYCIGGARVGFQAGKSWIIDQLKKIIDDAPDCDYMIFDGFTNDCNIVEGKIQCDVPLGERGEGKDVDIYSVNSAKTTFTQCFEVVAKTLKKYFPKAKVLFVRPHKMGRRNAVCQKVYGDRAAEICKEYGIAVADIYNKTALDTFDEGMRDKYTGDTYGWGKGDCTHPSALGYTTFYMPLIISELEKL